MSEEDAITEPLTQKTAQDIADRATALGIRFHLMPEARGKTRIYFASLAEALSVLTTSPIKLISGS